MRTAELFQRAVVSGDVQAIEPLLAPEVDVFGPVIAEPVRGAKDALAVLWAAVSRFDKVRYVGALAGLVSPSESGASVQTHMLRFRAHVAGRPIEGIDVLELDDAGRISTLTVLLRPADLVIGTGFAPRRHVREVVSSQPDATVGGV